MKAKVQLSDGRVKEFRTKDAAEAYAAVTGGVVTKSPKKAKKKSILKQFKDRT